MINKIGIKKQGFFASTFALVLVSTLMVGCTSGRKMMMIMGSNPLEGDGTAVVAGKQVYQVHCQSCHGNDRKGGGISSVALSGKAADLNSISKEKSVKTLAANITYGKGKEMPSFKKTLSENEIWQVAMYLKSVAK